MSSFNSFRLVVGKLFGSSLLSRFKAETIFDTSLLSVEVIKLIQDVRVGGNQNICHWKTNKGLKIYSIIWKIVFKGICNFRKISDCYIIICDTNGNGMDRVN